ncbi:MAG: FimV/HubP family polar landmark protein [Pseudohongiellaceae bacterium]
MLANKLKNYRKVLRFFTCMLIGLVTNTTLAFTLGDIRLNSSLNEPLAANIELLELDGLDEGQILVTLGSEADFERVGFEPLPLLNELEFEVEVFSNLEGLLRISSAENIVEPSLNFVLNISWPSGRVIKEYSVELDSPTFSSSPLPASAPTPRPIPPRIVEPHPQANFETVAIQSGDTLWNIALATRPSGAVSVQQMMLAIQRANTNSGAFIENNINGIRAGSVLRIPNRQEINAISMEQAITQVAMQNQQFFNYAQPLAVNNRQGNTNDSRDELSIINASNDNAESVGLNAAIESLENDLAFSEENLNRALLENGELRSRLNDLEEEIAILENIMSIESQRMFELQAELAIQADATAALAMLAPEDAAITTPGSEPLPPATNPEQLTGIINYISDVLGITPEMLTILVVFLALVVGFFIARNANGNATLEEDDFDAILADEENGPSVARTKGNKVDDGEFEKELEEVEAVFNADPEDIQDINKEIQQEGFEQDALSETEADTSKDESASVFTDNAEYEEVEIDKHSISSSLGNLGLDDEMAFDESDEEELEIITDQDEVSTKLDLAVAYQAMGDLTGAKEILSDVIAEGDESQIAEAQRLLSEWGGS